MKNLTQKTILERLRQLGPYLLIELLLPGGTLIALLLWLSQHNWADTPESAPLAAAIAAPAR